MYLNDNRQYRYLLVCILWTMKSNVEKYKTIRYILPVKINAYIYL